MNIAWKPTEYEAIGSYLGNFFSVIRFSIGDNDFSHVNLMDKKSQKMFWAVYFIIMYIMCIIFLNFIIAEASASYERVSTRIDNFLLFQKVRLI